MIAPKIQLKLIMQLLIIFIAVAATLLTYAASHHALRNHTALESARPIAAAVALLSGLSLLMLGEGLIILILIPYAALGLSLLLLPLVKWFRRGNSMHDPEHRLLTPRPPRRLGQRRPQPTRHRKSTSAHLRETHPPEE